MRTPLAALGLLLAGGAAAQTDPQPVVLEDIVVSADRAPTAAERTGSSVTVLAGPGLRAEPFVLDALAAVPGVAIAQNGPPGTVSGFALRGLPQQYARVLVDGIEVSDPTAPQVTPYLSGLLTGDIGRIEVLKGSQSALYGGQAVGGVIDIRTPRPERDGVEHRLALEGGTYDTWRGGYTLAARTDRADATVSLLGYRTDGFSAAEELDGNTEDDGYATRRASFAGTLYLTDTARLAASGFVQREEGDFDAASGVGADAPNRFESDSYGASLGLGFDALGFEHRLAVSRFRIERRSVEFTFGRSTFDTDGTRDRVEYLGRRDFGARLSLGLGADYTRERTETALASPGFAADSGPFRTWIAGGFGQLTWAPSEALTLGAALRLDHHSAFDSTATGRLTAAYALTPATTLRGSLGTGFRPPSNFELFDPDSGNPALEPEASRSADLGVEHRFAGDRGRVSATLFWIEVRDLIEFRGDFPEPDFVCVGPCTYVNVDGETRSRGLELAAEWAATERLTLAAGYSYTDAENPDGSARNRVPRHSLTLGVDADLTARLALGATLRHVADQVDRTLVPAGTRDLIGRYTVLDARLRFALTEAADLTLRAENLLDEQYQTARGYGTSDRALYLGLEARF